MRTALALAAILASAACGGSRPDPAPLVPTNVPAWSEMTLRATGRGAYPENASGAQARLMAERAARTDAYRKLTEQVYGLEVRAGSTVRDAVLTDDRIQTHVEGFIRGARVLGTRDRSDLGFVEVDVEIGLGQDFQRILFR
jgi:hypothetical protein